MISLMNQFFKVFIRIIHTRIRDSCERDFDANQFGFRQGFLNKGSFDSGESIFKKSNVQRIET